MTMTSHRGFTLIELAMVLFIMALILGGLLPPLSTKLEQDERNKTADLLEQAKNSLIGYALVNGHLPCPDCPNNSITANCGAIASGLGSSAINDGNEDGIDSLGSPSNNRSTNPFYTCATPEGNLPWATLGIDENDSWGHHFDYRVTDSFADDTDGAGSCGAATTTGISFQICSTGNINVEDGSGNSVAQNIPALIISYGRNAEDPTNPTSASEVENQNHDNLFIQKDYNTALGADEFDDMLAWVPTSTLVFRMVQAERLP
jgi:prepilin-type N-terminal cleavage/methylation domain-containing protein